MEDIFLSTEVRGRTICLSPLSARTYRDAGGRGLGGDAGYFLYEFMTDNPEAGIEIIAKAASVDAAFRLFEMLSQRDQMAA
jgi:hypothetical protein